MDATGGVVRSLQFNPAEKNKPIFLHLIVVNDEAGQYIAASMLSETHNTVSILFFLKEWMRLSAPCPKEFTSDEALAILTAAIQTFTEYSTADEYAAACENCLPRRYILIDVAHFIKLYVDFLSKETKLRKVKVFYKACIGQLIFCCPMLTKMLTKIIQFLGKLGIRY